jgi:hypothetical protein
MDTARVPDGHGARREHSYLVISQKKFLKEKTKSG